MRISNTVLLTMGSAMLISSSVAFAAPPISYGQYTATAGTITTNACPSGFTCGAAITGDGFLQRQVTETATGNAYFQTIILDKGSTVADGTILTNATFADESFVLQGGGTGIADSSHVLAVPAVGAADQSTFTGDTAINVGWAKGVSENLIAVDQNIDDPGKASMLFNLTDNSTDNSNPIITLNETVYMPPSSGPATGDKQVFFLKQLQAASAGTTVALPTGATPATTVSYSTGDIIQAMWLGQQVTGGTTGGAQMFGTQSYTVNPTTTATSVSYSDQTAVGPFNWDPVFGAAPTF
jgi:hypothetical protein